MVWQKGWGGPLTSVVPDRGVKISLATAVTQLAAHSGNLVTISPLPDEIDISYMRNAGTVRHGPSFGKRTVRKKKNDGTTSDDMQKLPKVP